MCTGRCPCGYTAHTADVQVHQVDCAVAARLYRACPDAVLGVEAEYERWLEQDRKSERAAAHAVSVAETDARREAMASRFATRDILED